MDLDADATVVIVDPGERRVDFVFERHVTERPEVHVDGTEVLEARWLPLTSELCDDIATGRADAARHPLAAVLVAAAVCPHPPLLVPELAAGAAGELDGAQGCV